jgi:hypothetical protein
MTLAILIFSSYIGIIALSFALTLVLAIFVATQLYVHEHEQAAGDLQHQGTVDGQLVFRMNFSKWRSGFSLFQSLDSLVYSHALDYYLVVVFLLCVVTNSIYNRLIVPFVMVFITFQLVPSLKRFAMKEWSNSAIITTMNLGNSSMFFFMFPYTLVLVAATVLERLGRPDAPERQPAELPVADHRELPAERPGQVAGLQRNRPAARGEAGYRKEVPCSLPDLY